MNQVPFTVCPFGTLMPWAVRRFPKRCKRHLSAVIKPLCFEEQRCGVYILCSEQSWVMRFQSLGDQESSDTFTLVLRFDMLKFLTACPIPPFLLLVSRLCMVLG